MDREELYNSIADRKTKQKDFEPYAGDNGRVNRCVSLMRSGKILTGGVLLDVGAGIGDLGHAVSDLFERRIALDISPTGLYAAKMKGNETKVCDVDRHGLPFPDKTIDVVTALDFIEHIIDPESFARECYRVLRSSGDAFINTPNIRFWRHIEQLWRFGSFPHTSGDREVYHGGHLAFYTFADLCEIFGRVGFVGFTMFKDDEGYENPPDVWTRPLQPKNQEEYVKLCLEFGCPNLLFKATRP